MPLTRNPRYDTDFQGLSTISNKS